MIETIKKISELKNKADKKKKRFERDLKNLMDEISRLESTLAIELPDSIKHLFGSYGGVMGYNTIAWGYRPNTRLSDEQWSEASKHGDWQCIDMGQWVLVTRYLTPEESVMNYGKVTKVLVGPRGGWKSATYGKTEFTFGRLDPRGIIDHPTPVTK